ncbi:MAG: alkaline phosphatase PafA [Ferruginibacter sp.]
MKKFALILAACTLSFTMLGQSKTAVSKTNLPAASRPKLIVGLVVDQMRWDYLYRYNDLYGNGGFKRILRQGFSCENTMIPYIPTYTAVGHSCIYTGSVPAIMGIVGNNWYDKSIRKGMYCTTDTSVQGVGGTGAAGQMSPKNLWATSITDELQMSTNFRSKVIGISLKDRGAILPAGHSATAAYWYDKGKFISSTYYMNALPKWVNDFNAKDYPAKTMNGVWNTLLPIEKYSMSTADAKHHEGTMPGISTNTFPYRFDTVAASKKPETFRYTPFGSTYTIDFAKAALENEKMGVGAFTDFLCISVSSTDYAGHSFGPNSIELEDTYLRLDKDLESFLQYLDAKVGKGNYLFFLSADHGAAHNVGFMKENKMPAGNFSEGSFKTELNKMIADSTGLSNAVLAVENYQVYIDFDGLQKSGKDVGFVKQLIMKALRMKPFVTDVFETSKIQQASIAQPIKERLINGFSAVRSGDIQFLVKPSWFDGSEKGTTHGAWNPYDSHIPLVWFGWGVKAGKTNRETYMTDIAPTIAAMLQIQMPNGCVGRVIPEVMK